MDTCYEGNLVLIELLSRDEVCEKAYVWAGFCRTPKGFSTVIDCCCSRSTAGGEWVIDLVVVNSVLLWANHPFALNKNTGFFFYCSLVCNVKVRLINPVLTEPTHKRGWVLVLEKTTIMHGLDVSLFWLTSCWINEWLTSFWGAVKQLSLCSHRAGFQWYCNIFNFFCDPPACLHVTGNQTPPTVVWHTLQVLKRACAHRWLHAEPSSELPTITVNYRQNGLFLCYSSLASWRSKTKN